MLLLVRRVVYRALVVGLGEFLLTLAFVPSHTTGASQAGYPLLALFYAVPAMLVTLLEAHLGRAEPGPGRTVGAGALTAAVAFVGLVVAHFQAIYAGAVITSGSVPDGIKRVIEQWHELFVTGTGHLDEVLALFLVAISLSFAVSSTLARSPRVRTRTRVVAVIAVTLVGALTQEGGRLYWNDRVLEHAAILTSLSLPVFFALADSLAVPPDAHEADER